MIDRLVMHIPFKDIFVVCSDDDTAILDISRLLDTDVALAGRNVAKNASGAVIVEDLYHPYESIPSWAAGMAVKTFPKPAKSWPYVEIKASPAKLLQGHNVYGTEDFQLCAYEMLGLLATSLPRLYEMLDPHLTQISSIDVTYSIKAPSQQIADEFIKYCASLRSGQTKTRERYPTTVYFGAKNSRHKRLKIYLKHYELAHYKSELLKRNRENNLEEAIKINSSEELFEFTKGLVRFEATVKKRWLQDRSIPVLVIELNKYAKKYEIENKSVLWRDIHQDSFRDLYKTFEGGEVMDYSDENVCELLKSKHVTVRKSGKLDYTKAMRAFRFYRSLASEGYEEVQATTPSSTFYRLVGMLRDAGISLAHLQNLHHIKSNVVPVIRLIQMDYKNQRPANYIEPVSGLDRPRLALVS